MAANAKKTFAKLVTSLLSTRSLTLEQYRKQMTQAMARDLWKLNLPGLRNAPEATQYKDEMKVLNALTDEEAADRSIVQGLRLLRISRQTDKPVPFVNSVLSRFEQMVALQRWLHRQHAQGRPFPETMEDAHEEMSYDPSAQRDLKNSLALKGWRHRMRRRGY